MFLAQDTLKRPKKSISSQGRRTKHKISFWLIHLGTKTEKRRIFDKFPYSHVIRYLNKKGIKGSFGWNKERNSFRWPWHPTWRNEWATRNFNHPFHHASRDHSNIQFFFVRWSPFYFSFQHLQEVLSDNIHRIISWLKASRLGSDRKFEHFYRENPQSDLIFSHVRIF